MNKDQCISYRINFDNILALKWKVYDFPCMTLAMNLLKKIESKLTDLSTSIIGNAVAKFFKDSVFIIKVVPNSDNRS